MKDTLTVTFEHLEKTPLGAAHAVGQIYGVPTPGERLSKEPAIFQLQTSNK